ncbi:unnamed protein product [[Candida] boidinii]|nr:unnamed protein product [[Candida] boidinii]
MSEDDTDVSNKRSNSNNTYNQTPEFHKNIQIINNPQPHTQQQPQQPQRPQQQQSQEPHDDDSDKSNELESLEDIFAFAPAIKNNKDNNNNNKIDNNKYNNSNIVTIRDSPSASASGFEEYYDHLYSQQQQQQQQKITKRIQYNANNGNYGVSEDNEPSPQPDYNSVYGYYNDFRRYREDDAKSFIENNSLVKVKPRKKGFEYLSHLDDYNNSPYTKIYTNPSIVYSSPLASLSSTGKLLYEYYRDRLCGIISTISKEQNMYLNTFLPMAHTDPSVLYGILAWSAFHLGGSEMIKQGRFYIQKALKGVLRNPLIAETNDDGDYYKDIIDEIESNKDAIEDITDIDGESHNNNNSNNNNGKYFDRNNADELYSESVEDYSNNNRLLLLTENDKMNMRLASYLILCGVQICRGDVSRWSKYLKYGYHIIKNKGGLGKFNESKDEHFLITNYAYHDIQCSSINERGLHFSLNEYDEIWNVNHDFGIDPLHGICSPVFGLMAKINELAMKSRIILKTVSESLSDPFFKGYFNESNEETIDEESSYQSGASTGTTTTATNDTVTPMYKDSTSPYGTTVSETNTLNENSHGGNDNDEDDDNEEDDDEEEGLEESHGSHSYQKKNVNDINSIDSQLDMSDNEEDDSNNTNNNNIGLRNSKITNNDETSPLSSTGSSAHEWLLNQSTNKKYVERERRSKEYETRFEALDEIMKKSKELDLCIDNIKPKPEILSYLKPSEIELQLTLFECFQLTSKIHLRQSVMKINASSLDIQHLLSQLLKCLDVLLGTEVESCLSFPVFIAGMNCTTQKDRNAMKQRIREFIRRYKWKNIARIQLVLDQVWAIDPNGISCVDWYEIVRKLGWDLSFA